MSYIIIPYIDNDDWNDENSSFKKCRTIIGKIRNVDESIEQKIKLSKLSISNGNKVSNNKTNMTFKLCDDITELNKIKLRLRHSKTLMSGLSADQDEYNYVQMLNKSYELLCREDYIILNDKHEYYVKDPDKYYSSKCVWKNWYDFLGVDVRKFIQTKD